MPSTPWHGGGNVAGVSCNLMPPNAVDLTDKWRRHDVRHDIRTARTRLVDYYRYAAVTATGAVYPHVARADKPEPGTPVTAGERTIGTLGSSAHGRALAMLRLDRTADALAAGAALSAGGVAMRLAKPQWARFPFPGEAKAAE